jgi:excisionase family DNA binding protein
VVDLLRVDQVAELLQVKPATVRAWIRDGHLAAVPLGPAGTRREYRIRRQALEAFLEGRSQGPDDVSSKAARIVRLAGKR